MVSLNRLTLIVCILLWISFEGYYLPAAIILFLTFCLSIRRCCNTCQADTCISSYCKEEMSVAMVSLPHLFMIQLLYLPNLDSFLSKLELPVTGLQVKSIYKHLMQIMSFILVWRQLFSVNKNYKVVRNTSLTRSRISWNINSIP